MSQRCESFLPWSVDPVAFGSNVREYMAETVWKSKLLTSWQLRNEERVREGARISMTL
jgi:hypothetical protein